MLKRSENRPSLIMIHLRPALFAIFASMFPGLSNAAEMSGWKEFQFGMTPEQVLKNSTIPLMSMSDGKILGFDVEILGIKTDITLVFDGYMPRSSKLYAIMIQGKFPTGRCSDHANKVFDALEDAYGQFDIQQFTNNPIYGDEFPALFSKSFPDRREVAARMNPVAAVESGMTSPKIHVYPGCEMKIVYQVKPADVVPPVPPKRSL